MNNNIINNQYYLQIIYILNMIYQFLGVFFVTSLCLNI